LLSVVGCDSIVNLTLEVIDQLVTETDVFLCPGDDYLGFQPDSDTTLVDTLQSVAGCDSLVLTNLLVSQVDELQIMGDTTICAGVSTVLDAGIQTDYNWSTGATTATIEVSTPGTYSVTVTDTLGCVGIATATVTEEELQATIVGIPPTCAGDADGSLAVQEVSGSAGPFQYALNGGALQETPVFSGLAAGTYEVAVFDPKGCSYQEQVVLEDPPALVIELEPQIELLIGDSVQLNPQINVEPALILWAPAQGLSCTDCLNPVASPVETTTYTLTVEDANGCRTTAEVRIVVDNARTVYIPNAFSPNGDGVNDFFMLFGGNDRIRQIDRLLIFNRWGGQVFEAGPLMPGDEQAGWDGTHNGLQSASGVYVFFAEITFNDGVTEIFKGEVVLMR
jgi:gliding motility-associated-like protein